MDNFTPAGDPAQQASVEGGNPTGASVSEGGAQTAQSTQPAQAAQTVQQPAPTPDTLYGLQSPQTQQIQQTQQNHNAQPAQQTDPAVRPYAQPNFGYAQPNQFQQNPYAQQNPMNQQGYPQGYTQQGQQGYPQIDPIHAAAFAASKANGVGEKLEGVQTQFEQMQQYLRERDEAAYREKINTAWENNLNKIVSEYDEETGGRIREAFNKALTDENSVLQRAFKQRDPVALQELLLGQVLKDEINPAMMEANQQAVAQMQAAQVNQQSLAAPLGGAAQQPKENKEELFIWDEGDAISWGE